MVITVDCPSCATSFPVDTNKVPEGGVNARCSECSAIFRVERPAEPVTFAAPVAPPPPSEPVQPAEPAVPPAPTATTVEAESPAEPEIAEPEAEPPLAGAYESEVLEEPAEPAVETEEAPLTTPGVETGYYESAEAEVQPESAYGLADVVEEALELEAQPESAGHAEEAPVEEPLLGDGSDWGALRELLEGADDLGTETHEAVAEDDVIAAEAPADRGDVEAAMAGDEAAVEEVAEELYAAADETVEEGTGHVPVADAPSTGDMVWDVDRDVEDTVERPVATPSPGSFTFGRQDPEDKARRLARVLVSDMVMYNPERHDRALNNDTLKEDFEEEIRKSWREYVEQVGEEMATNTTYWSDALNELLAKGQQIF